MQTCPACGTENPPGFRFCGGCAAALALLCPSCGSSVPPGFRFCGACGSGLDGATLPARGAAPVLLVRAGLAVTERRVCSVLFADLVGFTPLSESRDPEEVRELLSRYFDVARTVIIRYGGVVEKFIGDAVMAVWGTPVAAESDAERAVRAALDLVAAVHDLGGSVGAIGLALRAGVVTGEVAATIGAVGESMVAGDAVNTAARVQSAAAPGTVWVDSATQRLASAGVGFRATGAHPLKGKAETVELWEATRVLASVGGTQRIDGLEAPMIGRDAEERTVRELFHASVDRRVPRLVTVVGAAGSGKSRLGWEFEKYIDGLVDFTNWHRGRCLSYGDGVPYWALVEALRQRLTISAEDPVDVATAKFITGLIEWLPSAEERSFVGIRLGRLLGLPHPDDTGVALGQDDLFAGWRLFFERMADHEPVLLLIEDAHHADDATLDFVEHVADWARRSPIYVVLLGRSELLERRPSLAGGRNRTSLTLDPLDERSMRTLVDALVLQMPEAAVSAIADQAQGNPLFAVETIRSLIDRDVIVALEGEYRLVGNIGALAVPDSLHGLLAARLDALDPSLRALIADAAVLGTTFAAEALAAVSGRPATEIRTALDELVRRGVLDLSTDPLSPERGSYLFAQNMLRQVAYDTLSRRDRRVRHLAAAEHLQTVFSGGGDEIMDVVARHYLDALAAVRDDDDDEIRRRALASLIRAAERSERAGAVLRSAESFDQAAELATDHDQLEAARLSERAARAYRDFGNWQSSRDAAQRARGVYLERGESRAAARTLALEAFALTKGGRLAEARAASAEALTELRGRPDEDTVEALGEAAMSALLSGDGDARELADEAIGLAQALDVPLDRMADLLVTQGTVDQAHQRPVQSAAAMRHAAELAERAGDLVIQSRALTNLADNLLATDFVQAAAVADRACEVARRRGVRFNLAVAATNRAVAELSMGAWDQALANVEAVIEEVDVVDDLVAVKVLMLALRGELDRAAALAELPKMRTSDDVQDVAYIAWVDAVLAVEAGQTDRALEVLQSSFASGADLDFRSEAVVWTWCLAIRCALELDDLTELRRLVALIDDRPVGHLPIILRGTLAVVRAQLALADHGAAETVDEAFADAIATLRGVGSPYHLAHGLLDHVAYLTGRGREAQAEIDEAMLIGEQLGAVDVARRVRALDPVIVR